MVNGLMTSTIKFVPRSMVARPVGSFIRPKDA